MQEVFACARWTCCANSLSATGLCSQATIKTASPATHSRMVPHFIACLSGAGKEPQAVPAVAWFDAVLADVGDGQSLQQSLSTFSGHIRRVRAILSAITPHSLVLLDEV